MHILTACYVAKPKGHDYNRKFCGARMRNENGVWHVWQDVETYAETFTRGAKRKKVNEKTFKTKAAAEKYFNQLLES